MTLAVIGSSHHTAPVEVRERFAFTPETVVSALRDVRRLAGADEAVLLSTCNRTELYLYPVAGEAAYREAEIFFQKKAGALPAPVGEFLYRYTGESAARHLFRVSSGLDSLVTGEAEIQGQVREAYQRVLDAAEEPALAGPVLNRLFQTALSVGGRVRSETPIAEGAASVASVAVELATKIFGRLKGKRVLVLGAGEASGLVVDALGREGAEGVVVANRTYRKAADLAGRLRGRAVHLDQIHAALAVADIVVSSTGAPHAIITRKTLGEAFPKGLDRPLLFVDIAVPRDVAPDVGGESRVFLYNVDDLRQIVDETLERRRGSLAEAEAIVRESAADFADWYASLEVVPLIRSLRSRGEEIREAELERLLGKLPEMDEEARSELEGFSRRLLNKILHDPTVRLRESAAGGKGRDAVEAYRLLFGTPAEPAPEDHPEGPDEEPDTSRRSAS